MDAYATNSNTTAKMPTLEGIKKIMDDFERRWPKSERAVAIELPPSTEDALLHACGQVFPVKSDSTNPFTDLYGLRLERNMEVPYLGHAIRMADGSKVMHYGSGRRMLCLPEAHQ